MTRKSCDVVIVGGGIIGLASAYYLQRAGRSVTLLDKGNIGHGSSSGNCGLITPSHARPLTQPGMILQALRWMTQKDAPFYVRPSLNWSLLVWFLQFARRCNSADMRKGLRARATLLQSSRTLYSQLIEREQLACEWEETGVLTLCRTEQAMNSAAAAETLLVDCGLQAERFEGAELHLLDPAIHPHVIGGWLHCGDAHLRPDRLLSELVRILRDRGVDIREHERVSVIEANSDPIQTVKTDRDRYEAPTVVLATGAWSPLLARNLHLNLPIQPGKGYSITTNRPQTCPRYPAVLKERNCSVTPWPSGFRIGGTMEFSGYSTDLNQIRISALRRAYGEYYRHPLDESQVEWFGWRPMTYDGLPIIDRSPRHQNIFIAAGHNMLGVSMAPGTGRLITELVTERQTHIDPTPYSAKRFHS